MFAYTLSDGSRMVGTHNRTWHDLNRKPHIVLETRKDADTDEWHAIWWVYYLRGRQSRVRCTGYRTFKEACATARAHHEHNETHRRSAT